MGSFTKALLLVAPVTVSLCVLAGCESMKPVTHPEQPQKLVFNEVWGYLMQGREKELTGQEPFTDICYFAEDLNDEGRIPNAISRPAIPSTSGSKPRVHLVIDELSNSSRMHFSLSPAYGVRSLLVSDICRVSQDFDGVQIDFEAVSPADAESFWDFLKELRSQLPAGKTLSVALPARTGEKFDAYLYSKIAPIVDRIIIMAYDEHWSTSAPGPVASLPWCMDVTDYALSVIDDAKIVMGLPLYGRAWQDKRLSRALGFQNAQDLIAEKNLTTSYQSELGPFFEYSENVSVKVYYDDLRSLREKLELYASRNVKSVAFWRIGLGPSDLWNTIGNADQSDLGFPADSQY